MWDLSSPTRDPQPPQPLPCKAKSYLMGHHESPWMIASHCCSIFSRVAFPHWLTCSLDCPLDCPLVCPPLWTRRGTLEIHLSETTGSQSGQTLNFPSVLSQFSRFSIFHYLMFHQVVLRCCLRPIQFANAFIYSTNINWVSVSLSVVSDSFQPPGL